MENLERAIFDLKKKPEELETADVELTRGLSGTRFNVFHVLSLRSRIAGFVVRYGHVGNNEMPWLRGSIKPDRPADYAGGIGPACVTVVFL